MNAKQRIAQAAEQCPQEGYNRESDGKWVDPLPVQKIAIEEGFKQASQDSEFNVWTVANESVLREGDTVAENFRRVVMQWESTAERDEVKQAYAELQRRVGNMEQDPDEGGQ